jgi:hypothetical protein
MPIKSFRGQLGANTQQSITLHTNDGSIGYRIKKFKVVNRDPVGVDVETAVKIYKIEQTAIDNKIDFSDNTLLGAAFYENDNHGSYFGGSTIIFDNEIFNQDIYVTNTAGDMNYYIELEQIKLDLNENTVATLKDIRNIKG